MVLSVPTLKIIFGGFCFGVFGLVLFCSLFLILYIHNSSLRSKWLWHQAINFGEKKNQYRKLTSRRVFLQLLRSSKRTKTTKPLLTYYLSSNSIIVIWPKLAQIQSLIYKTRTQSIKSYNILLPLKATLKYHQNKFSLV